MLGRHRILELQNSHGRAKAGCNTHNPVTLPLLIGALCGLLALTSPQSARAAEPAVAGDATGPLQEIVVTATRHEESLSKVPISVTALTQESLDVRGIKDFQDVARFTPGEA